jgi:hypothetical protein
MVRIWLAYPKTYDLAKLGLNQAGEIALRFDEVSVASLLGDPSVSKYDNPVCLANGAQSVCRNQPGRVQPLQAVHCTPLSGA